MSLKLGRRSCSGAGPRNYLAFSSCWEKNTVAIGHDPFLVVLSVLIAVQASYVSLSLSSKVETSFSLQRRLLLGGAALSLHYWTGSEVPPAVDYVVLRT